jgi:hypothetical protein
MSREALILAPTFIVTCAIATFSVQLRCDGKGRPFGPRSRRWAILVIALTSILSLAGAVVLAVLGHHIPDALLGLGVAAPGGLCLGKIREGTPERRNAYTGVLTLWLGWLLVRMTEGMAEDKQKWCERHVDDAWQPDELIMAARAYHHYLNERLSGEDRKRYRIHALLRDVINRLDVVLRIEAHAPRGKIAAALKSSLGKDTLYLRYLDDPALLGRRLEHDARRALQRLVAVAYLTDLRRFERYEPAVPRLSPEPAGPAGSARWHP